MSTLTHAYNVSIVLSSNHPSYHAVAQALKIHLQHEAVLNEWEAEDLPSTLNDDFIITIGTNALQKALKKQIDKPLLACFIPRRSYEETLVSYATPKEISAVYLDQSMDLQIHLIKLLAPHAKTLGSVFGSSSKADRHRLSQSADKYDLALNTAELHANDNPIATLQPIIEHSDLFLAIPDQSAFNKASTKWSLFIALRARKGLIGFSEKYVDAGALAAVFSTPEQIGQQAAEAIDHYFTAGELLTNAHPTYFTVKVNTHTARLINQTIPSEQQLIEQLRESKL